MRKLGRFLLRFTAALMLLALIVALTGLLVVRSGWFHEQVRTRMISEIEKATGKKAKLNLLPMQPGDVEKTAADTEALRQAVGFAPSTPLSEGIAKFAAWYQARGHQLA